MHRKNYALQSSRELSHLNSNKSGKILHSKLRYYSLLLQQLGILNLRTASTRGEILEMNYHSVIITHCKMAHMQATSCHIHFCLTANLYISATQGEN
jgi:hypothetical protein